MSAVRLIACVVLGQIIVNWLGGFRASWSRRAIAWFDYLIAAVALTIIVVTAPE